MAVDYYIALSCRRQLLGVSCSVFVRSAKFLLGAQIFGAQLLSGLRLTQGRAAARCACAAIGSYGGWNDQSAQEQRGGGEDQEGTFHGCFLLVTANWTVILSCPRSKQQCVCKFLSVRNS